MTRVRFDFADDRDHYIDRELGSVPRHNDIIVTGSQRYLVTNIAWYLHAINDYEAHVQVTLKKLEDLK